ncbi:5'-methylthioadenosine/S-adenosylhomocysteine nucleosidase 1 [Vitis vinifera]|uniref:5'-methylthioadenosine/S-adenosylhomocysteine nucleosidase 1 n=1 Tax=Vitis vinifera TaxID=29760 RepID=A0A438I9B4_VITVI|nr:5'-methylthioadenosine/S-adenosylhomocysteine nucleosidase 1 [Vitis vinifera]
MAPHDDRSDVAEEAMVAEAEKRPIATIVIIIAMQTEALPLVNRFQLTEDLDSVFPRGVPWVRYHGIYKDLHISIIWPGKDLVLGKYMGRVGGTTAVAQLAYLVTLASVPDSTGSPLTSELLYPRL